MPDRTTYSDPLRRREVAATPEERVRQWFIGILESVSGVPGHQMMSEVPLHYGSKTWRADIVVYGPGGRPVALAECKRPDVTIDGGTARQALRYSSLLPVKFIFLTNGSRTYVYERGENGFGPRADIPSYAEMSL